MKAGGGGAPLRNASGKIVTYFRDDPIISFNEANRNHVNNELRYKTSASSKMQYKLQLGKQNYNETHTTYIDWMLICFFVRSDKMVADKDKAARRRSSDMVSF